MAINVYNTDNKKIAEINDNSIIDVGINLIGKKIENYIKLIDTNLIYLLENFANKNKPSKSVEGSVWFNKSSNTLFYKISSGDFISNAVKLEGKTIDEIREYVLSGLDTSGKVSKAGDTISGKIKINGLTTINKNILPLRNDAYNLGSKNNRFRDLYLQEDGIRLGEESERLTFRPYNFVYTVKDENQRVDKIPVGAIIVNMETGEAIIKKLTGKFNSSNNTFRKLAEDLQNCAIVGGNRFNFLGNKGLIAGGWSNTSGWTDSSIEQMNIQTPMNSYYFGSLSYGRSHMGNGISNVTKGVFHGGWAGHHGNHNSKIDYIKFAIPGNATYFGSFGHENYGASTVSDGIKGVIGPGYNWTSNGPRGHHYISKYITIESPANANYFGSIKDAYWGSAVSSGTRGVFGGYSRQGWASRLDSIIIQKPGNSVYFGKLRYHRGPSPNTVTDAIKGVYIGGWRGTWNNAQIEYITISTPTNAQYFGNIGRRTGGGIGLSNGTRGLSAAGWWNSAIDYITIQTPSNGQYFGSMQKRRYARPNGASGQ